MASIKTLQRSFSGGEISPDMLGRIDDSKYQSGLTKCRNFVVKPQGPVENRAGFRLVRAVKDSTKRVRLIPFTYSTTQTMVIEMGAGYFRFHTGGATLMSSGVPYEITNPYTEADLFDIHYVQSADVLTLAHPSYALFELRRLGATSWSLDALILSPRVSPPVAVVASGSPTTHQYKVTALRQSTSTGIVNETIPSTSVSCSNDLSIAGAYNTLTWSGVSKAVGYRVYKWTGAVWGFLSVVNNSTFKDTGAVAPAADKQPPAAGGTAPTGLSASSVTPTIANVSATATVPSGVTNLINHDYVVTAVRDQDESIQSEVGTCANNLLATGAYNTIEWPSVNEATGYNVYRRSGSLFAYVGHSTSTSFIDDNIAPDASKSPPRTEDPFTSAGNYPAAVSYYEQRRCFAGTLNQPANIWMTRSGTESNMSYSLPVRDDDRIAFRVAAREANTIRHIVPLTQLLLLTSAAEWRVTSVNSDAITPASISVRPQSYIGASNVQPVTVNNTCIYAAARGGHVRELAYSWQASGFVTGDLSLRAAHLFDSLEIVDMAYAKAPQSLVWFVNSIGQLLGLTYVPEQQVGAWHWHDTDGVFESCAVVAEGSEDVLYCVIRRTINGASVRFVERMASRQFVDPADAFFVDCGLTYSGAAATTISGLGHLEGETVSILADGAVHPQRVVSGGAITLDQAASKVQVGLPITADLRTLPLAAQIDGAFGQGRFKNVNKAWLRVYRSSGIFVGPDEDSLVEAKQRTTEPYGAPPALKSEEIQVLLTPSWADSGQIFVRQSDPLPLSIVSLTTEVALGA